MAREPFGPTRRPRWALWRQRYYWPADNAQQPSHNDFPGMFDYHPTRRRWRNRKSREAAT